jgi:chemotaxis protein CheD
MIREVHMGEGIILQSPDIILSQGLGSCVVVTIYDNRYRIGGLAHIMLPDSTKHPPGRVPCQFADTAISSLLEGLEEGPSEKPHLIAKLVGGAQMFKKRDQTDMGIGAQNIAAIKRILNQEKIPVVGEDIGGHVGRSVEFHLDFGTLFVIRIGGKHRSI